MQRLSARWRAGLPIGLGLDISDSLAGCHPVRLSFSLPTCEFDAFVCLPCSHLLTFVVLARSGIALHFLLRLLLGCIAAPALQDLFSMAVCVLASRCFGMGGALYQRLPGLAKKILKVSLQLLLFLFVWWLVFRKQ